MYILYWIRARLLQTSSLTQLPAIGSLLHSTLFVFKSPTVFKQTTTLNAKTPEIHRPTTWSQFLQASALLRSIVPLRWLHSRRIMRRVKGSLATARFSSVFILTSFSAEVKASLYSFLEMCLPFVLDQCISEKELEKTLTADPHHVSS